MTVIICGGGPFHEYSRKPDERETRWCFACRKHLPHERVIYGDPSEVMSYCEPHLVIECSRCHRDRTEFPGSVW